MMLKKQLDETFYCEGGVTDNEYRFFRDCHVTYSLPIIDAGIHRESDETALEYDSNFSWRGTVWSLISNKIILRHLFLTKQISFKTL
jgi:hypothetical protein